MLCGRATAVFAILICCGCSSRGNSGPRVTAAPRLPGAGRILDLTHPLKVPAGLLVLTTDPGAGHFSPAGLGTTMVDAPVLLKPGGKGAAALDTGALIGPAVVLDVRALLARGDPDIAITEDWIVRFEKEHGPLPSGCFVLLLTGWDGHFDRPELYLNRDARGKLHFPGFSREAVRFLISERDIRAIGTDAASVDLGLDSELGAHRVLFEAGKYAIENLRGLERLPVVGATLIVAPQPIEGAARVPARVLALVSR